MILLWALVQVMDKVWIGELFDSISLGEALYGLAVAAMGAVGSASALAATRAKSIRQIVLAPPLMYLLVAWLMCELICFLWMASQKPEFAVAVTGTLSAMLTLLHWKTRSRESAAANDPRFLTI